MPPRVSVVVVTWNGRPLLERFLPSVLATAYPNLEVVVADNASTDGTAAWLAAHHPSVRVVRLAENGRFCRGNNAAIPHTSGRYVCLLNNDVEVPPDWLGPLVEAMEADPRLGAVQPKLLQLADPSRFDYAGAAGGFLDRFGYPFARGRLFGSLERDTGQYDEPRDVFWASGAALLLRRAALEEVGLLDERLEMHMEEIDLCWRLWRGGWRVRAVPRARVFHLGGGSLPHGDARKTYYNFRNSFLLLHKHLPRRTLRRLEPLRYALDTLAAAHALARGRLADVAAIARAHRDYRRMKRLYPPPTDTRDVPLYAGSIALEHFVRGIRTFAELERRAPVPPPPRPT